MTNALITKEQTNFRSIKHEYDTVTTNKFAICNDEEIQDDGGTTTYYYGYLFEHKTFRW